MKCFLKNYIFQFQVRYMVYCMWNEGPYREYCKSFFIDRKLLNLWLLILRLNFEMKRQLLEKLFLHKMIRGGTSHTTIKSWIRHFYHSKLIATYFLLLKMVTLTPFLIYEMKCTSLPVTLFFSNSTLLSPLTLTSREVLVVLFKIKLVS